MIYTPPPWSETFLFIINQTLSYSTYSLLISLHIFFQPHLTSIMLAFCPLSFTLVQWNSYIRSEAFKHNTTLKDIISKPPDPVHHYAIFIFYNFFSDLSLMLFLSYLLFSFPSWLRTSSKPLIWTAIFFLVYIKILF